jgi:hypothetical protein
MAGGDEGAHNKQLSSSTATVSDVTSKYRVEPSKIASPIDAASVARRPAVPNDEAVAQPSKAWQRVQQAQQEADDDLNWGSDDDIALGSERGLSEHSNASVKHEGGSSSTQVQQGTAALYEAQGDTPSTHQ